MRKILLILLILAMLCSCSVSALAADYSDHGEAIFSPEDLVGEWINISNGNKLHIENIFSSEADIISGMATMYYTKTSTGNSTTYSLEGDLFSFQGYKYRVDMKNEQIVLSGIDIPDVFIKIEDFYTFDSIEVHNIGDTVSTDVVDFTLYGLSFTDSISRKENGISRGKNDTDELTPENGMIWAKISYNVLNTSTESIDMMNTFELNGLSLSLVYRNRYSYGMEHNNWVIKGHGGEKRVKWMGSSYGIGNLDLQPLVKEDYDTFIPVPQVLGDDNTSEIHLIVTLSTSQGTQLFSYRIQ